MTKLKTLIFATFFTALAIPVAAHADEVVEFKFNERELETESTRIALLEKIRMHSIESCTSGSTFISQDAVDSCAKSLERQYIRAIDNDELTQLAAMERITNRRTASLR